MEEREKRVALGRNTLHQIPTIELRTLIRVTVLKALVDNGREREEENVRRS